MGEERKVRRGGLVGPLILIGLGTVFLLNNLGVLSWSVWDMILRLWPVLLIAAGLDLLIGRRSGWGSLLTLVLILAVVAGAVWLFGLGILTGQETTAEDVTQALDGATRARVVLAPAAGTLRVESLPESDGLIEGTIRPGVGERVRRDFAVEGDTATFTLRSEGAFGPFLGEPGGQRTWELGLSPDVPLELEISLGAGKLDVDLTGLTVSDLDVSMGIGQTTVTLPDEGNFQAQVEGAIGQMVVVIPAGLEARIRASAAIGRSDLPEGYRQQGDDYVSPGYESAEHRVDLDVSQAIGRVSVRSAGSR